MADNPTKADSGRKGGLVTLERYGAEELRRRGKLGGRPRSRTPNDVRQRQLLGQRHKNKEVKGFRGNLSEDKKLFKLQWGRSSPSVESEPAGLTSETPQDFGYTLLATNLKPKKALPERAQR